MTIFFSYQGFSIKPTLIQWKRVNKYVLLGAKYHQDFNIIDLYLLSF
jgi:hypothetical protein